MFSFNLFNFFQKADEKESEIERVTLLNGGEVPKPMLDYSLRALKSFAAADPMALIFLYDKCKDRNMKLLPYTASILKSYGFLDEQNNVLEGVRDVVLSAVKSAELNNIELVNPVCAPAIKPGFSQ